jgi:hypothetical protein
MTTPADEHIELKELQERLDEKEGFGEAMRRLRRTQKMLAHRKHEVKVVLPTRGEWKTFRVYGSCRG